MKNTRIKICGIRRLQDASVAIEEGAHALGFIFYADSVRAVTAEIAADIVQALPPFVTRVGVFVNPTVDYVQSILEKVSLDVLQFQGDETEDFCLQFKKPYIKAIRMREDIQLEYIVKHYLQACAILCDSFHTEKHGGTGESFNWELVPKFFSKPIILSGGLNAENVAAAIYTVNPYAVDVASGVENPETHFKDPEKITKFMAEVKNVSY